MQKAVRAIDPAIGRLELISRHLLHHGEKGRLAELVLSQWLSSFLPKKYAISTGFVAASDGEKLILSPQRDIIIFDALYCSPIWKSEIGGIFPIECVYATMEVKTNLKKGVSKKKPTDLFKAMLDAHAINDMGKYKSYLTQVNVPDGIAFSEDIGAIPPRNFIIGYTTAFRSIDELLRKATEVVNFSTDFDTHCHGILILDPKKDWFIQRPVGDSDAAKTGIKFHIVSESGWDGFCRQLLLQLESMDVNERLHFRQQLVNDLNYPVI